MQSQILLVDEVLAVGDEPFQKKCIGKMETVGKEGRTVLFVSHNMGAVDQLCNSALFIKDGKMARIDTDVQGVIRDYLAISPGDKKASEWLNPSGAEYRNEYFTPLELFISDGRGNRVEMPVKNDFDIWLTMVGDTNKVNDAIYISYGVYTSTGVYLYGSARTDTSPSRWPVLKRGKNTLRARIPNHFLNEGIYRIELYFGLLNGEWYSSPGTSAPAVSLEIRGGLSKSPHWTAKRPGLLAPVLEWEMHN